MINDSINLKSILLKAGIFEYAKKVLIFKNLSKKLDGIEEYSSTNIFNRLNYFYTPSLKQTKGKQIKDLFKKINIIIPKNGFIFSLDPWKCLNYENRLIGNISVDYSKILYASIEDLKLGFKHQNEFALNELDTLDAFELLIDREIEELKLSNRKDKFEYINYLKNIKFKEVESFKEALQRILFYNQVLWQTNHELNGLGRLDLILNDIYEKQEGVPYNISLGGGTQGLAETIQPNYMLNPTRVYPLEKAFAGSFIGYLKSFKIYNCFMEQLIIENNYKYEKNQY